MELCAFKRNNFILYKLIPCLLIIMFAFMCLYGSKVYASNDNSIVSVSPNGWNSTLTFNNPNNYYIIISTYEHLWTDTNKKDYHIDVIISSTPFTVTDFNSSYYELSSEGLYTFSRYARLSADTVPSDYDFSNIVSLINNDISSFNGNFTQTSRTLNYNNTNSEITSFQDIYDTSDNLVFQAPSHTRIIVASQVGEVEMNKTLQEILEILPVVVVVLVGLIAIRKGILFLMARMKKV